VKPTSERNDQRTLETEQSSLATLSSLFLHSLQLNLLHHRHLLSASFSTPSATKGRSTTAAGALSQRWAAAVTIEFERLYNQREGKKNGHLLSFRLFG